MQAVFAGKPIIGIAGGIGSGKSFVAGLFGANTRLPGGGSWLGFELMVVLMVVSSIAVYWIMRRLAR